MPQKIVFFAMFYPVFLFSLSFHEAAHGWMANKFGDPTARLLGRITLNPIKHMDPIGTLILPMMAIFTGMPLIGWGKPVPVNSMNLQDARKDTLWISALGPISNLVLAIGFAGIAWGLVKMFPVLSTMVSSGSIGETAMAATYRIAEMGVVLNLALAFFNMIPIYPLDGGGVIRGLLPERLVYKFDSIARYGMFILLGLLVTGGLKIIFWPVDRIANLLLPY